jgi:hypothetical protein
LRIEGIEDPAGEIWRGFSLAIRPTAVILGRGPEDLLQTAVGGEVDGADAMADARRRAEHDGVNVPRTA